MSPFITFNFMKPFILTKKINHSETYLNKYSYFEWKINRSQTYV